MLSQSKKKIILFSSKPASNHSINMIKSAHDNNKKEYELWANDVKISNGYISNVWSNSIIGTFKLIKKLKKYNYINLQHEFNVWGAKSVITLPLILFLLRRKKISLCLHSVIDYRKVNSKFIKNFALRLRITLLYKIYFFLFFFLISKFAKKIILHSRDQIQIIRKVYGFKKKITLAYAGVVQFKKKKDIKKIYDLIIFGYIAPRKGLIELISTLENNKKKLNILIAGGVQNKYLNYYNLIKKKIKNTKHSIFLKTNIDDNEIPKLHFQSRIAIFGHTELLGTSGPLSIALGCDNLIIAPKKGIFLELLNTDHYSYLYNNYSKINKYIEKLILKKIDRSYFLNKLSWFRYLKANFE